MLIIGGTSLVVYPAAGLIDYYYHGNKLVLIKISDLARCQADLLSATAWEGAGGRGRSIR